MSLHYGQPMAGVAEAVLPALQLWICVVLATVYAGGCLIPWIVEYPCLYQEVPAQYIALYVMCGLCTDSTCQGNGAKEDMPHKYYNCIGSTIPSVNVASTP